MAADIRAKVAIDGEAAFKSSLQNIVQQSKTLAAEMKNVTSSFDKNASASEKAKAKMQVLGKQIDVQKTYIDALNQKYDKQKAKRDEIAAEYEKVSAEQGENSAAAQKLAEAYTKQDTQLLKTKENINKATTALNNMETEMRELESQGGKMTLKDKFKEVQQSITDAGEKLKDLGGNIQDIGKTLSIGSAAIAAFGKKSVDAFQTVREGEEAVISKTGATGDRLDEMNGIMVDIATNSKAGFKEAGDAVGEVATRFGVTGGELADLSEKFTKFSIVNNQDVTTSVDTVQKAMATFGVESSKTGTFLDVLTKAAQDTGVDVGKLSQGLVQNGTALQEMGLNASQSAVFMAQLEKSGANSETVMQGLRKALKNATKDGIPLNEALSDLQKTIGENTNETEALQKAYDLFGKSGDQIYGAVKNGTINFEDLAGATDLAEGAAGTLDTTYSELEDPMDGVKDAGEELQNSMSSLGKSIGTTVAPMIKKLSDFFQKLSDKWDSLSPHAQKVIVVIGLIAAAIGPLLVMIGTVVAAIGGIAAIAGIVSLPMLAIVAAIAAVIAIGIALALNWDKIKEKAKEVIEILKTKWEEFKTKITTVIETVKQKFEEFKQKIITTKDNVVNAFNAIKNGITTAITTAKDKVVNTAQAIWNTVTSKFNSLKDTVSGIFNAVKDAITNPIETAKNTVSGIVEKIKGFFTNLKLKIPSPSLPALPHFSLKTASKTILGKEITYPTGFNVSWYDQGGIFKNPAIIGVGEKRPEFVGALDDLRAIVREESGGGGWTVNVYGVEGQSEDALANAVMRKIELKLTRERAAFA